MRERGSVCEREREGMCVCEREREVELERGIERREREKDSLFVSDILNCLSQVKGGWSDVVFR